VAQAVEVEAELLQMIILKLAQLTQAVAEVVGVA
jgi:hypothetical protein